VPMRLLSFMSVKPFLALAGIFACLLGDSPDPTGIGEPLKITGLIGLVGYMVWNSYRERMRMADTLDKKDAELFKMSERFDQLHSETIEAIRKCNR
jgi:hypothetical protein